MATYDLTQVELSALLTGNIDPSVRDFVLNYLFDPDSTMTMGTATVMTTTMTGRRMVTITAMGTAIPVMTTA